MSVRVIGHYENLTKFHRGISDAEALVMVGMLNAGNDLCIVNDNEDPLLITRWEVTRIDGVGQLYGVSEASYKEAKANNFQPID